MPLVRNPIQSPPPLFTIDVVVEEQPVRYYRRRRRAVREHAHAHYLGWMVGRLAGWLGQSICRNPQPVRHHNAQAAVSSKFKHRP